MWVEWDDDAHLSRSQKKPGDYSPLTRDGNNKLVHVTLSDVAEDDEDEEDEEGWYLDDDPDSRGHGLGSRAEEPSALKQTVADVLTQVVERPGGPDHQVDRSVDGAQIQEDRQGRSAIPPRRLGRVRRRRRA